MLRRFRMMSRKDAKPLRKALKETGIVSSIFKQESKENYYPLLVER